MEALEFIASFIAGAALFQWGFWSGIKHAERKSKE